MTIKCVVIVTGGEKIGTLEFLSVPRIGETIVFQPPSLNEEILYFKVMLVQHSPSNGEAEAIIELLIEQGV